MIGLSAFKLGGQRYAFRGIVPHVNKDGVEIKLSKWQSRCPDCGSEFFALTPQEPDMKALARRCDGCKRPGVKVRAVRKGGLA